MSNEEKDKDLYNIDDVVNFQVSKVRTNLVSYDDLFQAGKEGYCAAKENHNYELYGKLTLAYVTTYIRRYLYEVIKKEKKWKDLTMPVKVTEEGEEYIELSNSEVREENILDRIGDIYGILDILNPLEREVIETIYLSKVTKTYAQLGEDLGVTKQRVGQIRDIAIKKLKKKMTWET